MFYVTDALTTRQCLAFIKEVGRGKMKPSFLGLSYVVVECNREQYSLCQTVEDSMRGIGVEVAHSYDEN